MEPFPKEEGKVLEPLPRKGRSFLLVDQVIGVRRKPVVADLLTAPAHSHVHWSP